MDERPPGWRHNPSAWLARLPALALALTGGGIATYLTLYQLDAISHVWEPFFGDGSRTILKDSSLAHWLPVPDAALGAAAYFLEALLDVVGGRVRWRSAPWAVLSMGGLAALLGLGGIALAILQPTLYGTFCTLCLGSAICSVLLFGTAFSEVRACWQHLRRETAAGRSLRSALWPSQPERSQ